ncbi:MAG: polysaccharide ABC transporter ATP-binding protein [Actinomycetota bacterium]|nr:polysaccharide ABC transporter ATP-binding protein [Actinomycetota bacterium]
MTSAIEFHGVSKHYRGARKAYRMARDDLVRFLTGRRGPDDAVRALEDVTFEVPEGEALGLVGANGAGKTTLLKLACRITYPTRGRIRVRGRVGALIEVGTGMHPELTGRENVALYGRILGLSRNDVRRRFDQIVEFADIGAALDRPLKQFSSGMQLRLGFSLAAHLEPDVLLVDEAIAVGDAGFQYRCVERISTLVREGRTLVFVSHNMSAVEALCTRSVLVSHGRLVRDGPTRDVIREYLHGVEEELLASGPSRAPQFGEELELLGVTLLDEGGREVDAVQAGGSLTVRLSLRASRPVRRPVFELGIADGRIGPLAMASMLVDGAAPEELRGDCTVECTFRDLPLMPRVYELWGGVMGEAGFGDVLRWQRLRLFRVEGEVTQPGLAALSETLTNAPVQVGYSWDVHGNGRESRPGAE